MQKRDSLFCISPVDGRYEKMTEELTNYLSEFALIKYRVKVEIRWLLKLFGKNPTLKEEKNKALNNQEISLLENMEENFGEQDAKRVKEIEEITKHDVKAIEYYLREKIIGTSLEKKISSFIHFACTSEDINNLAYACMLTDAFKNIWIPTAEELIVKVEEKAKEESRIPMLAHTHGQAATPTTVGKEFAIFAYRWKSTLEEIKKWTLKGKWNGAVGNWNAHVISYPNIDWFSISKEFVESFGLQYNPMTTQIESHDSLAMLLNLIKVFNNITMDFNSDMWLYISMGYFKQKVVANEVGSSVMPHKVNPIQHENSMANIRIANAILTSLADNLPISRMQRDLSDSSSLRNLGVAAAHSLIAIKQSKVAFEKMQVNIEVLEKELEDNPEVIAEAIQTILRKYGYENAYELLKEKTRGKSITLEEMQDFIQEFDIAKEEKEKEKLKKLNPKTYLGLAIRLASEDIF